MAAHTSSLFDCITKSIAACIFGSMLPGKAFSALVPRRLEFYESVIDTNGNSLVS
jgi:hypothetical protein